MSASSRAAVRSQDVGEDTSLPWMHIGIVGSFMVTIAVGDVIVFGYQVSGLGWLVPLVLAALTLGARGIHSKFPLPTWIPWSVVLVVSAVVSTSENAVHRTLIMLTPIVVGVAAGSFDLTRGQMLALVRALKITVLVSVVAFVVKASADVLIIEREAYAFPAEAIAAVLMFAVFASMSVSGYPSLLPYALLAVAIPILSVNRGPIVAVVYVVCLGFIPIRLRYRIAIAAAGLILGIVAFHLEAVQAKMFFSGSGTLADLYPSNPDLRTSGRQMIWEYLFIRAVEAPWFGYGANASEQEVLQLTEFISHPHNDWLRLFYDYGLVGVGAFLVGYLSLCVATVRAMRRTQGLDRTLFSAAGTALVAFGLLMITDNIILYTAYYTAPLMLIVGVLFGRQRHSSGSVA